MATQFEDDDDDPIINEIPVFLSQKASDDLRLLQFPIRSANRSLEQDSHQLGQPRVQYDVEKDRLTLKYYLNTDSEHYINESGDNELTQMSFSSKLVQQTSNYGIGIIRNNQMYLSPIKSVYQMRRDFNHCNPKKVDDENAKMNIDSDKNNRSIINCQIIHDKDNEDLYFDEANGHQTRQFIKDKNDFLKQCFQQNTQQNHDFMNRFNVNKTTYENEPKYTNAQQIPPGITQNEALSLPLSQSTCYYLRECIVLNATQTCERLKCTDDEEKSFKVFEQMISFGYLIGDCFVCRHKYLRDSSLRLYKSEWNLLIVLFYKNKGRLNKKLFFQIVGEDEVRWDVIDKMLHLLAVQNESNLWCLKHQQSETDRIIKNKFSKIYHLASESMQKLHMKTAKIYDLPNEDAVSETLEEDTDIKMRDDKEEEEVVEVDDGIRQSAEYMACSKFVVQKLKKNKVLGKAVLQKLITKYSKSYPILTKVSDEIMQKIEDDLFWRIDAEKFCLKEIEEFEGMKQFNEHRRRIIDWFNGQKKEKIKESTAKKQWKGLSVPSDEIFQMIMESLCDWNQSKNAWFIKSGKKKK